jgi:hypothetical protein
MPGTGEEGDVNTGLLNVKPEIGKGGRRSRRTAWQKRTGLKGIGPLKEGLLKKVGYSVTARASRRHAAVKRAVKKYGRASTIRKLNAVAVYTRKRSPMKSRTFRSDMKFAQKMKGGQTELDTLKNDVEVAELEAGGDPEEVPKDVVDGLLARASALGMTGYTDLASLKEALKNKLSGR